MIAKETARISAAMESYVQHGVTAMGQLAGSTDSQVHSITTRDDGISARVQATIDERMAGLTEQLQLVYDRMASGTIALHEEMTFLSERIGVDTRETTQEIGRVVDSRARGLAQVVRSDSEALRRELVRLTEAHDEQLARVLDGRLGHVADALTNAASSMAAEVTGRIREEMSEAFRLRLDETATRMETLAEDQSRLIDTRMHEAVSAIDRNVVRLTDSVEGQFERMGRSAGKEAAAELAQAMDSRIASLAKLVRSDNEMLAEQIVADQEASKQALRAVKELQASLPADVIGMVEERLASLAESIERSNEMLVSRIDRMGERVGEQQSDEIQVVLDRMGDAMHALASLGKPAPRTSEPRIALE
jgi:DNA-binding PadR family transcriptional regulator